MLRRIPVVLSILIVSTALAGAAPPVFQTIGEAGALSDRVAVVEGEDVAFTVQANDPDGDPLLWSAEGLPAWLELDPATGRITGRAPLWPDDPDERNRQPGAFDLTISVTDGTWTVRKVVTVEVQDADWKPMTIAELMASRPVSEAGALHTPVELSQVQETTFTSQFGGVEVRRICFAFTSQVPAVEGWEDDWISTLNCAYLPADGPAVPNAGAVVEGCYSQEFGDQALAERVVAELGIPVLVIDRAWESTHPSDLMGLYDQTAASLGEPGYLFYAFSTYHFLRAADALVTVIDTYTDWPVSFDEFRTIFTGHSKFGHTSFLTAGADPGRVAGFLSSGAVGVDGNSGRILGYLQGATGVSPESHPSYLGTMMRAYVTDRLSQAMADPGTVALLTLGTDDSKGGEDGYTPKYTMLATEPVITLPHRMGCIPNAPHTTRTPPHSTMWEMLLAHVFLGRPLGAVERVRHRQAAGKIEVTAELGGGTTIRQVTVWATNESDVDISHWDGFVAYPATSSGESSYTATIPASSTAFFVEVLDTADGIDGLFTSSPEPVNRDYPLLPIPPDDVGGFTARPGSGGVDLSWTNPESTDLAGVLIVSAEGSPPASPLGGTVVYDGLGTSTVHATRAPYYTAFTYDAAGNYSAGVTVSPSRTPRRPSGRVVPRGASSAAAVRIGGVNTADPVVKPLLGVVSGPDQPRDSPAPNLTAHFHDIGVLTVRNNGYFDDRMDIEGIFNCGGPTYPSWEGCDPQDEANYFWESSDELFESWLSGGFEPFLRLGGEMQNADRHHDFKGPQNATQEQNWIQAAQKVVDRYLHWGGRAQTFTYLDIWTEFPNGSFWDRSNPAFYNFWIHAFVALKAAFPELKIGGPGFFPSQAVKVVAGEGSAAQEFLAHLYRNGVKPDWIGWHLFYNDPLMFYQAARAYRDLLDGKGLYADVPWAGSGFFDDVELIVDAYGVSQMGLTPQEKDRVYNHQKGAAIRTASWIAMQYGPVERAYLYRSGDPYSSPGDDPDLVDRGNYTGLFYGDPQATYKPSAHAFRLWSQVVSRFPTLLTTPLPPSEETGNLWVLAARNDEGQIAVLVSNVTTRDVSWTLTFDVSTMGDYRVEVFQVDDEGDGRVAQPQPGYNMTTPAESVQLVILTRI